MPRSALLPLWEEVAAEGCRRWGHAPPSARPGLSDAVEAQRNPTSDRFAATSSRKGRRAVDMR